MSTPASWPELAALLELVDPRLREPLWAEVERCTTPLALRGHVVLVGHRGAGKSRLLKPLAEKLGWPAVDLDVLIAERAGVPVRTLFQHSEAGFRRAEREAFASIEGRALVAAGGGFLSHHADLLEGHTAVLVPVTYDTYVERMRADTRRPRLRIELTIDEEIETVFAEREALHRQLRTVPLAVLLKRVLSSDAPARVVDVSVDVDVDGDGDGDGCSNPMQRPVGGSSSPSPSPSTLTTTTTTTSTSTSTIRGDAPVRVVTLPRGAGALAFANRALELGALALELRDDLTGDVDAAALSQLLPLLIAHRGGGGFSAETRRLARWEDLELGHEKPGATLVSHHAARPLSPDEADALWSSTRAQQIKHVEPLGPPASGARLLETQARLIARFGEGRVTVLATGSCALPWRAVLARRNAFDYLAVDSESASAPGQRLLADAVRADAGDQPRLAIIGHRIAHARSPRAHPQPFDRWDLPPDAPVAELVDALKPHYRGFAITAPFKRAFGSEAINTLVRRPSGWATFNTDVDGARAVLARHGVKAFTALGDGGATWALRQASSGPVTVVTASAARNVSGDVFWTWPEHVPLPKSLRLDGARVFVITYGAAASRLCARIRELGGTPVRAGATWFIAQARAQRRLWQEATS